MIFNRSDISVNHWFTDKRITTMDKSEEIIHENAKNKMFQKTKLRVCESFSVNS